MGVRGCGERDRFDSELPGHPASRSTPKASEASQSEAVEVALASAYVWNCGGLILLNNREEVVAGAGYRLNLLSVEMILPVMDDQITPSLQRTIERRRG